MITYGFYDSLNHDRKYNAIQFGSIFDGIVRDGIFMSIGNCFRVIPGEDMMLLVQPGRAWFNHTWTLNDAPLPIYISQSEVILNRIDAVVIDVDQNQNKRRNDIIVVKGTPSSKPVRPTLIHDRQRNQYPLAYISVRAGVTSIRAADITSMIGTSSTPYVTGILDTVNIDSLLDQWKDQWQEFYEKQTADMEKTNAFWKEEWQRWYEAQTNEIQESYLAWQQEWELWSSNYKTMMENTAEEWNSLWNAWFYSYVNQNEEYISNWQQEWDTKIKDWYYNLNVMLDGDVAANLANRILQLESCCEIVKDFMSDLTVEHSVYDTIYDGNSSSEPILDSMGDPILGKVIFVSK